MKACRPIEGRPGLGRGAGPGPTLVAQSASASLLVVGTRENAGWSRLVHGSVSHYCLSHARCPVVVVPAGSMPACHAADTALTGTSAAAR